MAMLDGIKKDWTVFTIPVALLATGAMISTAILINGNKAEPTNSITCFIEKSASLPPENAASSGIDPTVFNPGASLPLIGCPDF